MRIFTAIVLTLSLVFASPAFAHSGGTDDNGCHTNSDTGDYHCHNSNGGSSGRGGNIGLGPGATIALVVGGMAVVGGLVILTVYAKRHNKANAGTAASLKTNGTGMALELRW